MSKKRLGKGLGALFGTETNQAEKAEMSKETSSDSSTSSMELINIADIEPNKDQPRTVFDKEKLDELAQSIKEHGVLQPIILKKVGLKYKIIVGERRYRASKVAGLKSIPAYIKEIEDKEITEIALIENIQRENLNPIEEAKAYRDLVEKFGLTQDKLAKRLGKSRPYIANMLRLLTLPDFIQSKITEGIISNGHGRALAGIKDTEMQKAILQRIIEKDLSVRQTEELLKKIEGDAAQNTEEEDNTKESIYEQLEDRLRTFLGSAVKIKSKGKKGKIEIEYYSDEDLNRILELFLGELDF